jgi:hypothetical protein
MANTFITPTDVIRDAGLILRDRALVANLVNRSIEGRFVKKIGDTVSVKVPAIIAGSEFTTSATASNVTETSVDVTIDKHFYVKVTLSSDEIAMELDDFNAAIQVPAVTGLVGQVEDYLLRKITGGFSRNVTGTAGTDASTHAQIIAAEKTIFDNQGPTDDLVAIINSTTHASLKPLTIMNSLDFRADAPSILAGNALGALNSMTFYRSVHSGSLDVGATDGTANVVDGTSYTGSSLGITNPSYQGGLINEGARFTIAGVSGTTYTVTSDTTFTGYHAVLPVTPDVAAPDSTAAITFETAVTECPVYSPMSVAAAIMPGPPGPGAAVVNYDGLGLRIIQGNVSTTTLAQDWVWDLYVGAKVVQPAFGTILQGA